MTRTLLCMLAAALSVPAVLPAQTTTPVPQPSADELSQGLRTLERTWVSALVTGDIRTLGTILDDTYMDTDEDGHQQDKNTLLAALKSKDLKIGSIQLGRMRVHAYGYTAVVTGQASQVGVFKGKTIPPLVAFTDTFVMIDGRWKIVASQRTAVHTEP